MTIPVIDVFAGPGGLNEGFSAHTSSAGVPTFETRASFELDPVACETLRLRAAVRAVRYNDGELPREYYDFLRHQPHPRAFLESDTMRAAAKKALDEVVELRLGEETRIISDEIISARIGKREDWVLVGGPPCQAYSLVGRSRRSHDENFEDDHKHFLYREYLHILEQHRPAVFVMENVKGMLSATHGGSSIFSRILRDLESANYQIRSLVVGRPADGHSPSDFVIRSEHFGVPQRRHRVILLGVRNDLAEKPSRLLERSSPVTVAESIGSFPKVRSTISPVRGDSEVEWASIRGEAIALATGGSLEGGPPDLGAPFVPWSFPERASKNAYSDWVADSRIGGVVQHHPRSHMRADLRRYAYMAAMSDDLDFPRLNELPVELLPLHKNVGRSDTPFTDRFRVQVTGRPSTTVVSHIAKDGHYFIHPDPTQMRSLTVREAARLQSFPDDYFFCGPRTQQYHQVGNAVPPFLAKQIAEIVSDLLV